MKSTVLVVQVWLLASVLLTAVRAGYDDQEVYAPQPYQFGYETQDEYGNRQSRHEQDSGNGVKTGSYGYRDAYGLFRQVQYVADAGGFRAWVKTNEPGTQDSAPAAAKIDSQQPHGAPLASAAAGHYAVASQPRAVPVAAVAALPVAPAYVPAPVVSHIPVHNSLYPVAAASSHGGRLHRAHSHQVGNDWVPIVQKHTFRRLAVAAPVVAPVVAAAPAVSVVASPIVHAQASSPVVVDLAHAGPYRTVKKVRRPKPAEFFKKSIVRKRRPKTPRIRVRVVSASKNGELHATDVPVYKDK